MHFLLRLFKICKNLIQGNNDQKNFKISLDWSIKSGVFFVILVYVENLRLKYMYALGFLISNELKKKVYMIFGRSYSTLNDSLKPAINMTLKNPFYIVNNASFVQHLFKI